MIGVREFGRLGRFEGSSLNNRRCLVDASRVFVRHERMSYTNGNGYSPIGQASYIKDVRKDDRTIHKPVVRENGAK